MNIASLTALDTAKSTYTETITGNSDAILFPIAFNSATVQISNVNSGTATVQYTLSSNSDVEKDTASWHSWSHGAVSTDKGIAFDSPIVGIRVIGSAAGTTYNVEVLV